MLNYKFNNTHAYTLSNKMSMVSEQQRNISPLKYFPSYNTLNLTNLGLNIHLGQIKYVTNKIFDKSKEIKK